MENITLELDALIKKGTKEKQAKAAANILLELYNDPQNIPMIALYLMKLMPFGCRIFFKAAIGMKNINQLKALYSAILKANTSEHNGSNSAITRGFILASVLIKQKSDYAKAVIGEALFIAKKNGKYSDGIVKLFKKEVIEHGSCGISILNSLSSEEWDNPGMRNRFIDFMQLVNNSIVTTVRERENEKKVDMQGSTSAISEFSNVEDSLAPIVENNSSVAQISSVDSIENTNVVKLLADDIYGILKNASFEASKLLRTLTEGNGTVLNLRQQITERDTQISSLKSATKAQDEEIENLKNSIIKVRQVVSEKDTAISELKEQLESSYKLDRIAQSQELLTLKENLANGLKLEYEDYLASKDLDCSTDNYVAALSSLNRVFKILRRFEILTD